MEDTDVKTRALQKGSAEFLVLAVLDGPQRHGYEIAQLIATRSDGRLKFHAATLYPLLYKLEKRGLVEGRWVEKAGQRRARRTAQGLARVLRRPRRGRARASLPR
jgi:PadR family transcriptional regulator PadR